MLEQRSSESVKRYQIIIKIMWVLLIMVIGVVLALLFAPKISSILEPQDADELYTKLMTEGDKLYAEHKYSAALKKYVKASDNNSSGAEAYRGMITVLVDKNLFEQADKIMETADAKVKDRSKYAQLRLIMANRYYALKMYEEAQQQYEEGYKADTDNSEIKTKLLSTNLIQGNTKDLSRYLISEENDKYFSQNQTLTAYMELANSERLGDVIKQYDSRLKFSDESIDAIKNGGDIDSEDELYYATILGREYIEAGYPALTVIVLEPYKDEMNEYSDGLYLLGRSYYETKQYTSARECLLSAAILGNNLPKIYLLIARSYWEEENVDLMTQFYERAIDVSVDNRKIDIMREYAEVLLAGAFYNKCEMVLNDVAQYTDAEWLTLLYVQLYYKTEQYDKMNDIIGEITDVDKLSLAQKRIYYEYYIQYALKIGEEDLAKRLLESFLSFDKYNPKVHFLYGKYWLTQADEQEHASISFETAIELDTKGLVSTDALKLLAYD